MKKLLIFILACLLSVSVAYALDINNMMTVTNQWTHMPDWIRSQNQTGQNITADNFFKSDGTLINDTDTRWGINSTSLVNESNGKLGVKLSWLTGLFVNIADYLNNNGSINSYILNNNDSVTNYVDAYKWVNGLNNTINGSNYNETYHNYLINGIPLGWANLTDYPIACPAGSFISQLGDSITCTAENLSTFNNTYHNFVVANVSNSTTWWAGVSGWVHKWFVKDGNDLSINETQMNVSITERINTTRYYYLIMNDSRMNISTNSTSVIWRGLTTAIVIN